MNGYKVFYCSYRWSGRMGAYEEKEVIVIAETEGVALSLVVHEYADTVATDWTATEIPTDKQLVHHVSERSN